MQALKNVMTVMAHVKITYNWQSTRHPLQKLPLKTMRWANSTTYMSHEMTFSRATQKCWSLYMTYSNQDSAWHNRSHFVCKQIRTCLSKGCNWSSAYWIRHWNSTLLICQRELTLDVNINCVFLLPFFTDQNSVLKTINLQLLIFP